MNVINNNFPMNNSIIIIWKILNLNLKKYEIKTFSEDRENWIMIFWVKNKEKYCTCPKCNNKTNKRQDLIERKQKTLMRHINISNNRLIDIQPIKRYFRCTNCWNKFLEKFEFESEHWYYTKEFERYVISSFWFISWNQIAKLNKLSASKVYRIVENVDYTQLNRNWIEIMNQLDEIYLWIDEHSFSWNDMILIITELKTKQLLAVLPNITRETLEDWINSIPLKTQFKIKWFSTDMHKWYKKTLENIIWRPIHSVDKYHLFQETNRMVDEVRLLNNWLIKMNFVKTEDLIKLWKIPKKIRKKDIEEINKISSNFERMNKYKPRAEQRLRQWEWEKLYFKNSDWEKIEYREITLDYYLENWYRKIFLYREKNLSWLQRMRLNQIFREFDYNWYLVETWTIKEDFMDAIDNLNLKEVDRIIRECEESEHMRIKQFWRTLKNWYKWIKWFIEYSTEEFKFTNALTESMNNNCKILKRQSYGFKYKENYFRKIFINSMLNKAKNNLFSN